MVILCDTREQSNRHITDYFTAKGIAWEVKKLNTGDYSAYLPPLPDLFEHPAYFDRDVAIERKANLDELASNFTKDRERIKDEFTRAKNMKFFLLVEDANLEDILSGHYRSNFKPESFIASLISMEHEYNFNVKFTKKQQSGRFIHMMLYYYLRLYLLGKI